MLSAMVSTRLLACGFRWKLLWSRQAK